ncbi:MAG: carboxylating nicotinate-nucleotide diphosphorylase [Bacteroidetes bacterium]|nr:carboxylating nicotinate-nucleotide diphosphorylase [Bacteroidota bacterium]
MTNSLLAQHWSYLQQFVKSALNEDIQEADHTTQSTVEENHQSVAKLVCKDTGIWAGNPILDLVTEAFDSTLQVEKLKQDGDSLAKGDIIFTISGSTRSILTTERVILNFVQHLSGIATKTNNVAQLINDLPTNLLDTRKTTPGFRVLEKWAVSVGGGKNHRFGLYDMVMIKDNHIDQCGSITKAVERCVEYQKAKGLRLRIEVETRTLEEVQEVMSLPAVDWIMLDNFSPDLIREALQIINKQKITEASGGINDHNIRAYAETGVDFISSGSLTQRARALDLSLKIVK